MEGKLFSKRSASPPVIRFRPECIGGLADVKVALVGGGRNPDTVAPWRQCREVHSSKKTLNAEAGDGGLGGRDVGVTGHATLGRYVVGLGCGPVRERGDQSGAGGRGEAVVDVAYDARRGICDGGKGDRCCGGQPARSVGRDGRRGAHEQGDKKQKHGFFHKTSKYGLKTRWKIILTSNNLATLHIPCLTRSLGELENELASWPLATLSIRSSNEPEFSKRKNWNEQNSIISL